jgi:hypothetical protein
MAIHNATLYRAIINGEKICFHDQKKYGRWHKLVKKSELKNYNRNYRRRGMKS